MLAVRSAVTPAATAAFILNLEPEHWPAGVPDHATHPMTHYADCDNGPTKKHLMDGKDEASVAPFHALCFGKRPKVEFYDCKADPDQVRNLANNPEYTGTIQTLRKQLEDYLTETGDPRFTQEAVPFDQYPYRTGYLEKRLERWRAQQQDQEKDRP